MPILTENCKRVQISKLNADLTRLSSRYQSVLVEGAFWLADTD